MLKFIKQIIPGLVMAVALFTMVSFANSMPTLAQSDLVPRRGDICQGGSCPVTGNSDFADTGQEDLLKIIIDIARFLTFFGVGLSVLFMVWGGIQYIVSNGNEETATKGKTIIINATIGLIISIVAFTVVNIIAGLVSGTAGADIISGNYGN
jgi:hypothetical protein